jgi:ElaB/YqjD/DUF883 family membrane-anchored ribosome-binding protein
MAHRDRPFHGVIALSPNSDSGTIFKKTHIMKTQDILEQADQTAKQVKSFYNRAVEKTCEGSKAVDDVFHHHTYKLLATGMLMGLVAGCLVSQRCRCCSR